MSPLSDLLKRNAGLLTRPPVMTPTNHFPDGPLFGNGDMTAVLGGPGDLQAFYVGKSDFWTDGGDWNPTNEEYDHYVVSPITVGGVRLWMRDFALPTYRQEIDLERAEVRGTFTTQETTVRTRAWLSATDNLLVVELSVEGVMTVGFQVRTFAKQNDDPRNCDLPTEAGVEPDGVTYATRATWDKGRWVSRAALATRLLGLKREPRTFCDPGHFATSAILLAPGETVTIVTALAGGKNATTHVADALALVRSVDDTKLKSLHAAHLAWWQDFWSKSAIDLGGDVVEKFWYGAQYGVACCSRAGNTAPGIFGFSTHDHPRWSGDYHLNYNFEHPFQAAPTSNRPELALPYMDAICDFIEDGKIRAARDVNPPMPGVYFPIGLGPWGIVAQDSYMSQKCAAAFAAVPFIEDFYLTLDRARTQDVIFPYCKLVGEFWEAYLRDEAGRYVIRGSASHEHGGNDMNANFDLPLVKKLFVALIDMADFLQLDEPRRAKWKDIVARLSPYPTAEHNGKTVFKESENAPGYTRSISLFNVIWPGGGDVHAFGDPRLCRVARDTLETLNLWSQGNSFSWVFPAAARVGMPGVYDRLKERLEAEDGLRDNLTYAQPFGGIETFGGAAAVNEMLLQSHDGVIRVFPAWPRDKDASFASLRARGAVLVDATLKNGTVTSVRLHATVDGDVRVQNPWRDRRPRVEGHVDFHTDGDLIRFRLGAGQHVTMT